MRLALTILAGLCAFLLPWAARAWRARRWGLPARVTIDPAACAPREVAGYFAQVAQRLDARPERMRLTIAGGRGAELDFLDDGRMEVRMDGRPPHRFSLRGRWIPDHPVPLGLARQRLYVEPVDGNRFRVMTSVPFRAPAGLYIFCSLLASVGTVRLEPVCLALAAGLALGALTGGRRG